MDTYLFKLKYLASISENKTCDLFVLIPEIIAIIELDSLQENSFEVCLRGGKSITAYGKDDYDELLKRWIDIHDLKKLRDHNRKHK